MQLRIGLIKTQIQLLCVLHIYFIQYLQVIDKRAVNQNLFID